MSYAFFVKFLNSFILRTFIKVFSFYFLSYCFLVLFFKILLSYPSIIYLLILVILLGLLLDDRIKGIRKLLFGIFLFIHFAFWFLGYSDTEIIIIKELF